MSDYDLQYYDYEYLYIIVHSISTIHYCSDGFSIDHGLMSVNNLCILL